ncbi:MAG: hypothetical protein AVDCRST_MAG47-787 [uncultured Nocardioidaceae bacterium]|uniref:Carbohydrate kinase PfkB domain-containing protein n=1 Tax=uncultured Nocardioidaceae bacterium TaxID=253824 RepID=A0A6J4MSU5_9ACTN|nr:MAG: hypothetical protein AVDCRST_MAG47-787 [uncultured Nocardioidaceae bacterium]
MTDRTGTPSAAVVGSAAAGKATHLSRLGVTTRLLDEATEPDTVRIELAVGTGRADLAFVAPDESLHRLLPALRDSGVPVWVDLADWDGERSRVHDPFVEAASCVFLSDIELDDPLRTAEQLVPGKELVVITHGKRGATAFFPDTEPFFVLPHDVGPVVDTAGVRDAFCSGVAYGFVHGWDWPRALRAGAVVAGGCVAVPSAVDPGLTTEWLHAQL